MSRTHRKPLRVIEENETTYVKRQLAMDRRWAGSGEYTKMVKRRKPKDQYEAEYTEKYSKAWEEYQQNLKIASYDDLGRPYFGYRRLYSWVSGDLSVTKNYLYEPQIHVSKYYYERVTQTTEEREEVHRQKYAKFSRDGHWNETGRNTGFKKASSKVVRRGNKKLCHRILKDEDYDHLPYPNEHDGDYLRWSFW